MNLSNEQKQKVIEALEHIIENGPACYLGICYDLDILLEDVSGYDVIQYYCQDWEHFSGDEIYPVPGKCRLNPWQGKQLEYRQSLMRHIVKRLQEETQSP